jgi:hypothetical protein
MFEKQCVSRRTCSLETPLCDVVETPVPELLISLLAGLFTKIGPRRSRSQAAGWITGCFSPAKTMAVKRAGSGLASSNGIPGSSGGSEESQNAGDIKRILPCAERQSEAHEKMTEGKHYSKSLPISAMRKATVLKSKANLTFAKSMRRPI